MAGGNAMKQVLGSLAARSGLRIRSAAGDVRENCAGRRARRVCFIGETSSNTRGPSNERERGGTEKSVPTHTHTQTHTGLSGNSELRHHRHGRLRRHRQTLRRELCALGLKLTVTEPAYGTAMIVYGSEITVSKRVPGECVRVHYACVPCVSKVRVWRERCRGRLPIMAADQPAIHGHSFAKKTFHKPTYCHHCSDMLWGLIQQGYICEDRSRALHTAILLDGETIGCSVGSTDRVFVVNVNHVDGWRPFSGSLLGSGEAVKQDSDATECLGVIIIFPAVPTSSCSSLLYWVHQGWSAPLCHPA
uniref:Phorbol-ester/DAG-type domain-containing protein n=1 Tax=Timema tahoe TaxID=61484 RepID=A0A7R9I9G8_9NEOP|nr:unnamed protein product [Timema tahoe]